MRPRAVHVVTVGVCVLAVAMGLAAYGFGGRSAPSDADPEATKAVPVTRMTLVDYEDAPGQIGYGPVTTLRYLPPPAAGGSGEPGAAGDAGGLGLLTWLPPIGSTVDRGGAALRVDDRPVVVLFGALPLYRALHAGERGADVRQLEQNLAALGLTGFTVDDDFTASTAAAVRRWQHALALPETGQVAPGQVVFTPGAIRVADHRLRVGDVATGDILGMTGTVRTVTATVDTTRLHRVVAPGSAVTIVFDDGAQTLATVRSVDRPPVDPQAAPAKDSVVLVEAEVSDQAALADREGAVTVRFVADERPDVLAVPVLALVALAEGGYGVEVVEGSTTRYVPVTTGLFARGYVEITSGDLRAGMTILVPA